MAAEPTRDVDTILLQSRLLWESVIYLRSEISGSHGGEYENDSLLGYCTV
jgi:hypothetical protein